MVVPGKKSSLLLSSAAADLSCWSEAAGAGAEASGCVPDRSGRTTFFNSCTSDSSSVTRFCSVAEVSASAGARFSCAVGRMTAQQRIRQQARVFIAPEFYLHYKLASEVPSVTANYIGLLRS